MKIRYAILGTLLLVLALALTACAGAEGPAGPAGAPGEAAQMPEPEFVVQPETCTICHSGAGDKHQASYDELYQDGVIQVTDLDYRYSAG
jgi:ABC-type glycerol-3-phosphate transport system substrate-binding protein